MTIGVAAFAVLRERFRRPKLSLEFDSAPGANDFLTEEEVPGGGAHYVRMRIANGRGKDTAHGVEVLLDSVRRLSTGTRLLPGGYAFRWSNTLAENGLPRTQLNIASGAARHFDLIAIIGPLSVGPGGKYVEPENRVPMLAAARLEVAPTPAGGTEELTEGEFELRLVISADNCDAKIETLRISFDGTTAYGEAIREHLAVSHVR